MVRRAHHKFSFLSKSQDETKKLAQKLGRQLHRGFICLYGDLGAGKTTFVQGLAKGLGIRSRIQSPTFTYSRVHGTKSKLYHFDCYRLRKTDELFVHELHETLQRGDGVIAIEWAEKIASHLPEKRTDIHFEYINEKTRKITIEPK